MAGLIDLMMVILIRRERSFATTSTAQHGFHEMEGLVNSFDRPAESDTGCAKARKSRREESLLIKLAPQPSNHRVAG
jgi:hypothetical protein